MNERVSPHQSTFLSHENTSGWGSEAVGRESAPTLQLNSLAICLLITQTLGGLLVAYRSSWPTATEI